MPQTAGRMPRNKLAITEVLLVDIQVGLLRLQTRRIGIIRVLGSLHRACSRLMIDGDNKRSPNNGCRLSPECIEAL